MAGQWWCWVWHIADHAAGGGGLNALLLVIALLLIVAGVVAYALLVGF